MNPPVIIAPQASRVAPVSAMREQCEQDHELGCQIMKRIAEVATQSLRATQRRLMQYIDKNIPEKP